jgi:hypothetical protein
MFFEVGLALILLQMAAGKRHARLFAFSLSKWLAKKITLSFCSTDIIF